MVRGELNYCLKLVNSLLTSWRRWSLIRPRRGKGLALGPDLGDDVVQNVEGSSGRHPSGADLGDVGYTPGHVFEPDFVRHIVR